MKYSLKFRARFLYFFITGFFILVGCKEKQRHKSPAHTASADSYKNCIETILKKDDSLGTLRNHGSETVSLSETIKNYSKALKRLDFSSCPEGFSKAFDEHISAWNQMLSVTDKYPDLRGELHDIFDQIKTTPDSMVFETRLKAIWDTWESIDSIKKKHSPLTP